MRQHYVLALDQGTTSSRAIVFNQGGRVVATAQRELSQLFPAPGHVEHDPEDIWNRRSGPRARRWRWRTSRGRTWPRSA